jgi:hypothetical protein
MKNNEKLKIAIHPLGIHVVRMPIQTKLTRMLPTTAQ